VIFFCACVALEWLTFFASQMLVQSMGGVYDRLAELEAKVTKHGEHTSKMMSGLRTMEDDVATKIQESALGPDDRTGHTS